MGISREKKRVPMYQLISVLMVALLVMCKEGVDVSIDPLPALNTTRDANPTLDLAASAFNPRFVISKAGQYNGINMGVKPGDTVGILAGTYANLILEKFIGTPDKPIVFLNYKGRVSIEGTMQNYSNLSINGCEYFVLAGSGEANMRYGFRVSTTFNGVSALVVSGKSTNCEIARVEIAEAGFAGMMIKTDPSVKDPSTWLGNFDMQDVRVHDNYVHDTVGEGLYIGNSSWNGGINGMYPHEIHGLQVHHNLIERTGAEGIQYSCSPGARVHHNIVISTGIKPFANFQNGGVQISGGSSGEFYDNVIDSARGGGLMIIGALRGNDSLVVRNVIVAHSNVFDGSAQIPVVTCAIYADERGCPPGILEGGKLIFERVTVYGARLDGFRLNNQTQYTVVRRSVLRGFPRFRFDRSPDTVPLFETDNFYGPGRPPANVGYQPD